MAWCHELHYREKEFTVICCAIHRNDLYTGILNSEYYFVEPVAKN